MDRNACELARKLARIQLELRREMLEELLANDEDLATAFDPHSFSPLTHEVREKYLSRIYLLQSIIQQLAHLSQGGGKHATRVLSLAAQDRNALVSLVNRKLMGLNGAKVMDVTFMPGTGNQDWSALITYEIHPFMEEADETAAWM